MASSARSAKICPGAQFRLRSWRPNPNRKSRSIISNSSPLRMKVFDYIHRRHVRSLLVFSLEMQQDCLLVGDDFTDELGLLHLLDHCSIIYIEICPIGHLGLFILPQLLKLIIINPRIPNRNPTLTFPPILRLHPILPLDVFKPIPIKRKFNEILTKLNRYGIVCSPSR